MASAPPEDFRCPISLELMSDPVILATGQTYDRSSIQRWLDAGHRTCPKTKQVLSDMKLIPNYALRSVIQQWAATSGVELKKPKEGVRGWTNSGHGKERGGSAGPGGGRQAMEGLVKKVCRGGVEERREAMKRIRDAAKESKQNRDMIVEEGGIAAILSVILGGDLQMEETGLQSLFELSLDDENKVGLVAEGAVDVIVQSLKTGSMEIRAKAASILTRLAFVDVNKATIGSQIGAIPGLVLLLAEGNARARKEAMNSLYALCIFHDNKPKVVSSGAVPILLSLLIQDLSSTDPAQLALAVLDLLSTSVEGRIAIIREPALPTLVTLLRSSIPRCKEHAAAVLWSLCSHSKKYTLQAFNAGALDSCLSLMQIGTARAKRKASLLVKAFQECSQWQQK